MANQNAPASGMTVNTYGSSTYAVNVKREWIRRLEQEAQYSGYFERFTGEIDKFNRTPDAVVMRKTELNKGGGDSIIIPMKMNISPTFIYGDATLLGNETSQAIRNCEVKVNQWRGAVSGPAGNANFRIKYLDMLSAMKDDIIRAVAREKDADHFRALCEGFSLNLTTTTGSSGLGITKTYHPAIWGVGETTNCYANATSLDLWVSATGTVSTNDILDLDAIDAIKGQAKIGTTSTDGESKIMRIIPLNLEGKMWYILLCHPSVIYGIQSANSNAWRTGVEYAGLRGDANPFFTGATWAYNGVILHEHPDCPSVLGGGDSTVTFGYKDSNTNDIKCSFLMGQGPLAYAAGSDMKLIPEDYDYQNQRSIAAAQINGIARADFASQDGNSYKIHQGSLMIVSYGKIATI